MFGVTGLHGAGCAQHVCVRWKLLFLTAWAVPTAHPPGQKDSQSGERMQKCSLSEGIACVFFFLSLNNIFLNMYQWNC